MKTKIENTSVLKDIRMSDLAIIIKSKVVCENYIKVVCKISKNRFGSTSSNLEYTFPNIDNADKSILMLIDLDPDRDYIEQMLKLKLHEVFPRAENILIL